MFVADLHIHSKFSRATSRDMDVSHLVAWARWKGIQLMGTGDFTHHLWLQELKNALEPVGNGLFMRDGIHFMLSAETSHIFSRAGKVYRTHLIIFAPSFEAVEEINNRLSMLGNLSSDGRPILGVDPKDMVKLVMDVCPDNMVVPAHIWTPWFSLFGSQSGFNAIEDCFQEQTKHIYALETGLSSDPEMNWMLSQLDRYSLISNSDSHSPSRIGREANVFECKMDYYDIMDVLKKKDKERFLYTVEFFPQEGKYHYDGHRKCGVVFSPQETQQHNAVCPVCKKPLTVGVMSRVAELSDRAYGSIPENAIPFKRMIPLEEIIADVLQKGTGTKAVETQYQSLVHRCGSEFAILMEMPEDELHAQLPQQIADAVMCVRNEQVEIRPGFDGEYGRIKVVSGDSADSGSEQLTLF
jgi:uncharacterized protein (TIGR00375 family)